MARGSQKRRRAQNGVQAIFSRKRSSKVHLVAGLVSIGTAVALGVWIIIASASPVRLTNIVTLVSMQATVFIVYSLAIRRSRGLDNRRGFSALDLEDEIRTGSITIDAASSNHLRQSRSNRSVSLFRIGRSFVVASLVGLMLTTVVGFSAVDLASPHSLGNGAGGTGSSTSGAGHGSSGTATKPPVGYVVSFRTTAPSFYALSSIAEAPVSSNNSYTGVTGTNSDDFIVVQIAYSVGSGGNLPDIATVTDTQASIYTRAGSASPGVWANFWEQAWTGRAVMATNSTSITVSPDWLACQRPCVTSIIIMMTIGRYRNVAGVGSSVVIAPNMSSTSQSVNMTTTQWNSTLVELLSHGAYSNCGIDPPQPGIGQQSRSCVTATTERSEFFDHTVTNAQTYTESFTWAQVELQRGIYLELKGKSIPT